MLRLIALAVLAILFSKSAHSGEVDCAQADHISRVQGKELCLVIRTFAGKLAKPDPTLVVFLHGDTSSGGPSSYLYPYAERWADERTISVAMIRPGYYDNERNQSTGSDLGRRDNYMPDYMDAVADAVSRLKVHHKAARVVLFGHSGGAATAANILGRHPGLANAALLLSCPCNLSSWRAQRDRSGASGSTRSLSPHSVMDRIPEATIVVAAVGEGDSNTQPILSKDYAETLAARGVKARYLPIPGAGHNFDAAIRENAAFNAALRELVSGAQ